MKTTPVWAEVATTSASVVTKEGESLRFAFQGTLRQAKPRKKGKKKRAPKAEATAEVPSDTIAVTGSAVVKL